MSINWLLAYSFITCKQIIIIYKYTIPLLNTRRVISNCYSTYLDQSMSIFYAFSYEDFLRPSFTLIFSELNPPLFTHTLLPKLKSMS